MEIFNLANVKVVIYQTRNGQATSNLLQHNEKAGKLENQ